ncbi:6-phosphogluconate dehydrogenase, NAD(+)-dependent, decarboxylating [uncultured archaeon]|nr:6-phosphogluconate dehydrogenase, NAD(+)-dependent, decarboxylating [uncultured archaeon]
MKLGFVGLGRMGSNMALRLLGEGHRPVVYNRSPAAALELVKKGAVRAESLAQLCKMLPAPRVIWLMVPAGKPVDEVIAALLPGLQKGDIIIDGGNSNYKDSKRRFSALKGEGIHFLDIGTSGGLSGARNGACLTIGGEEKIYRKLLPLFRSLSAKQGFLYCGPAGAGHYVKTVHNGIEYAMLQAYGEGFAVLDAAPYRLNMGKIAGVWSHGSVIRSWLLELAADAFGKDARLSKIEGVVGGGETGGWAIAQAKEAKVRAPSMELALRERKRSAKRPNFAGKVVAAIRNEFGGHAVQEKRR